MPGLIQDSGMVWEQRPWCGWISIKRTAGRSTLDPFNTRIFTQDDVVPVVQTRTTPPVEVSEAEAGPLSELRKAVDLLDSGVDQLAAAPTAAKKKIALIGLKAQADILALVIGEYESALAGQG